MKSTQVVVLVQSAPPPVKTYEIEARNLCYKIDKGSRVDGPFCKSNPSFGNCEVDSSRCILKNVSFEAKPGEVLAIAGPSGAGKSTLLEVLAGRIRPSSPADRSILINHQPVAMPFFRRISGYIPQDDVLFPSLTVEETLMFSANMRLPPSIPKVKKEERVRALMSELGLQHVAHKCIGNEDVRGVSGGERRRVSIGVDVIHDPAVLLLDEPTSGLDSAGALNVMDLLHRMAKTHFRTIILSIHQPGYRILQLINSFLLLANGSVVHHGPLDLLHHRLVAAGHKIPGQVNVLEYAIEAMAAGSGLTFSNTVEKFDTQAPSISLILLDCAEKSMHLENGKRCSEKQAIDEGTNNLADDKPIFANDSAHEIIVLSQRFARNIFRTRQLFATRTIQGFAIALALGTIYKNVGYNQRGMEERLGFFAFTLTCLLCGSLEDLPIFLQEKQVLHRETSRGAYRISSYLISNMLVFLPFLLFLSVISAAPVYWLVGLSSSWGAFFFFVLIFWLMLLTANSFVALFSALVPSYIMANSLISACTSAFYLFSGYFISRENIPVYWRFMHYLSFFKYPLDALLINEYSSLEGKCFGLQSGQECSITSDAVLKQLGLDKESKWLDVAVMLVFICAYRALSFLALQFKVCKVKR